MRRLLARVDPVLVQAVIAAALSFAHLHDIANAAGQSGWKAWAYPISVDLLLVASWRRLRQGRAAGTAVRLVWVWFLVALTASLGANVATAGLLDLHAVPAWLRILVAGWPAAAFLGGTLLAHAPHPEPTPPAQPDTPLLDAPAPPDVSVYRDDVPAPAVLPEPDPVPAISPAPPAVEVPAALLDLARKLTADADRAGTPLTPDALRTRLGVPAPLADAITAQLA
ncbi:DUF2637 domain-containing protein [Streptacidiphilus carbonis]|uniref:DUF2637 domain-containing protein n=1 Tax=Streptacidiphilus carbonis TaxID=105422 RepID=UPI0005AAB4B3|nr:DUF2637 domain-containing protein [Streptacidiphilus carbonis]